jgi:hypothetical protein
VKSVSMTVLVAGACVCMIVSIIVASPCDDPPAPVAAAGPPSTATTEYVALLTSGSTNATFRGTNGNDELRKKREDKAKRDEFEVLSRMSIE